LKLREQKIKDLSDDKSKLKTLLKKAKVAIDSLNSKYKSSQENLKTLDLRLREALERNRDLTTTLEIFQSRRNGLKSDQVKRIVARVRVEDVGYALVESRINSESYESECEWYKDSQVINIQEELKENWVQCKQINYSTIFDEMKKTET